MHEFTCRDCGAAFVLPARVLDRYPGWTPRQCLDCRNRGGSAPRLTGGAKRLGSGVDAVLTTDEVLAKHTGGPASGAFTDGGAVPNPGPGGWGAVYVVDGEILGEANGHEEETTNNRMELRALIEASKLIPEGTPTTVYSDSNLAVQTINQWAAGWEKRNWKRKSGPVQNLDLVKQAYYAFRRRPELKLEWIAAHSGYRWNEYADALASKWRL